MARTWEVRSMDEADTAEAVKAARRADQTVAEWLTLAIREKIAREHAGPGEIVSDPTPDRGADAELERCLAWAKLLPTMSEAGSSPPQWLTAAMYRKLASAIGVAPPAPRQRSSTPRTQPFKRLTQPPRTVGGEPAIVPGGEELHHAVELTDIGD
jgi:hypothetical protein